MGRADSRGSERWRERLRSTTRAVLLTRQERRTAGMKGRDASSPVAIQALPPASRSVAEPRLRPSPRARRARRLEWGDASHGAPSGSGGVIRASPVSPQGVSQSILVRDRLDRGCPSCRRGSEDDHRRRNTEECCSYVRVQKDARLRSGASKVEPGRSAAAGADHCTPSAAGCSTAAAGRPTAAAARGDLAYRPRSAYMHPAGAGPSRPGSAAWDADSARQPGR